MLNAPASLSRRSIALWFTLLMRKLNLSLADDQQWLGYLDRLPHHRDKKRVIDELLAGARARAGGMKRARSQPAPIPTLEGLSRAGGSVRKPSTELPARTSQRMTYPSIAGSVGLTSGSEVNGMSDNTVRSDRDRGRRSGLLNRVELGCRGRHIEEAAKFHECKPESILATAISIYISAFDESVRIAMSER